MSNRFFPALSSVRALVQTAKSLDWQKSFCDMKAKVYSLGWGPLGEASPTAIHSRWTRPPRRDEIRVPVPLLEEFGLLISSEDPGVISGRMERDLFPLGFRMLTHAAYSEGRSCGPIFRRV